jgi:hypothetical protein
MLEMPANVKRHSDVEWRVSLASRMRCTGAFGPHSLLSFCRCLLIGGISCEAQYCGALKAFAPLPPFITGTLYIAISVPFRPLQ